MKSLKSFDLFPKVSPDHSPQSVLGGLVSVLAITVMTLLFLAELQQYSGERVERQVRVSQDQGAKLLQINFNVTLWNVPCAFVAVDHLDVLVDYQEGIRGAVTKRRVGSDLRHIPSRQPDQFTLQELQALFVSGEFCVLEGTFQVAKVPGFISFVPTNTEAIGDWKKRMRFDHTISHLSFGRIHKHQYLNSVFGEGPHTNFAPYDGTVKMNSTGAHIYYSKVIPITYIDEPMSDVQHSYHFSMNYNNDRQSSFPYFSLNYDVETVTVTYLLKGFDWKHFAVHMCAVLGGVYAVVGFVLRVAGGR